jgi:hypothetical protein
MVIGTVDLKQEVAVRFPMLVGSTSRCTRFATYLECMFDYSVSAASLSAASHLFLTTVLSCV